jgi:hypothetical protein
LARLGNLVGDDQNDLGGADLPDRSGPASGTASTIL